MSRFKFPPRIRTIAIALLCSHLSGCGKPAASVKEDGRQEKLLAVVSSGFNSCKKSDDYDDDPRQTPLRASFLALQKALVDKFGTDIRTLVSCFPRKLFGAEDVVHVSDSTSIETVTEYSRADFYAEASRIALAEGRDIIAIGHSYGGWSTMQFAGLLTAGAADPKLTFLATIDPIDPAACNPRSILLSQQPGQTGNPGCKTAPTSIPPNLQGSNVLWQNYFQEDFALLHSSAIGSASKNLKVDYRKTPLTAHSDIQSNLQVWDDVKAGLFAQFSKPEDDPSVTDDLYLAIGEAHSGDQARFFASSNNEVEVVELCIGTLDRCNNGLQATIKLQPLTGGGLDQDRRFFAAPNAIQLAEEEFSLYGKSATGKLLTSVRARFARK